MRKTARIDQHTERGADTPWLAVASRHHARDSAVLDNQFTHRAVRADIRAYVQRRLRPLNLYLREQKPDSARLAAIIAAARVSFKGASPLSTRQPRLNSGSPEVSM